MKPGGIWEFIMHSPDGVDFPNTNVFVEVVKPEMRSAIPKAKAVTENERASV